MFEYGITEIRIHRGRRKGLPTHYELSPAYKREEGFFFFFSAFSIKGGLGEKRKGGERAGNEVTIQTDKRKEIIGDTGMHMRPTHMHSYYKIGQHSLVGVSRVRRYQWSGQSDQH